MTLELSEQQREVLRKTFAPDYLDFARELNAANARWLLVGGLAVGAHGHPRATKDMDVLVQPSVENGRRTLTALARFGAPAAGATPEYLATPGNYLQIGVKVRIDVINDAQGFDFDEAWDRRCVLELDDVELPVISLEDLLAAKRAAGRPQDLADVRRLERIQRQRARS